MQSTVASSTAPHPLFFNVDISVDHCVVSNVVLSVASCVVIEIVPFLRFYDIFVSSKKTCLLMIEAAAVVVVVVVSMVVVVVVEVLLFGSNKDDWCFAHFVEEKLSRSCFVYYPARTRLRPPIQKLENVFFDVVVVEKVKFYFGTFEPDSDNHHKVRQQKKLCLKLTSNCPFAI